MSFGLRSRASSAALLPESHSPHWEVAIEFGSRTAMTPGTSYACPHFGQRISGMRRMIAEARTPLHSASVGIGSRFAAAWRAFTANGAAAGAEDDSAAARSALVDAL